MSKEEEELSDAEKEEFGRLLHKLEGSKDKSEDADKEVFEIQKATLQRRPIRRDLERLRELITDINSQSEGGKKRNEA